MLDRSWCPCAAIMIGYLASCLVNNSLPTVIIHTGVQFVVFIIWFDYVAFSVRWCTEDCSVVMMWPWMTSERLTETDNPLRMVRYWLSLTSLSLSPPFHFSKSFVLLVSVLPISSFLILCRVNVWTFMVWPSVPGRSKYCCVISNWASLFFPSLLVTPSYSFPVAALLRLSLSLSALSQAEDPARGE